MTATTTLDDPTTPVRLHEICEAMRIARVLEHRGRIMALSQEFKRICSSIREEMRDLCGHADPDLLIALWSTAQISHADGLEYAKTDSLPAPTPGIPR